VLRIIHQAFLKEMMQYAVCFKVDQLCSLIGLMFAAFTICFPQTFITLFFGAQYSAYTHYFMLVAIAGLIYSLFSSLTTKAMLEKRDRPYAITASLAALLTIVLSIILSFYWGEAMGIGLSLLAGEIVFAAGMLYIINRPMILEERLRFLLKNLLIVIIPLGATYFFGDEMPVFIAAAVLSGIVLVWIYHNKFAFE
ncbi:MAG TPA: hypothetical protein VD996_17315, partial [Chitinophagaceae bacterium]|nr:hypothetical protein [Chitinophagaceae bacterium]